MRENKSPLTISQSLKVYTGTGLIPTILILTLFECVFFLGSMAALTLMVSVAEGMTYTEAITDIGTTPTIDYTLPFIPTLLNCVVLAVRTDRGAPGGKFFRTVKGGIGTFVKSRVGIYISLLAAALVLTGFVSAADAVGIIKIQSGIISVVVMFISTILSLGAGTFSLLIGNDFVRGVMGVILSIALPIAADALLIELVPSGAAPAVFTAAVIIGAALLAVSFRIYLSYYKKNLWNS